MLLTSTIKERKHKHQFYNGQKNRQQPTQLTAIVSGEVKRSTVKTGQDVDTSHCTVVLLFVSVFTVYFDDVFVVSLEIKQRK